MNGMKLLYIVIAFATALHTSYGAAYVMQGPMPVETGAVLIWSIQGLMYALAIDVGMFVLSDGIRTNKQRSAVQIGRFRVQFSWYVITFAVVAVLSAYFQIVYGYLHSQSIPLNTGVSEYWNDALVPLLDARIIIVPLALPLIAILYALGGLGKAPSKRDAVQPRTTSKPPEQTVQVTKPPTGQLPAPKTLTVQKVYEHLEAYPEAVDWPVRRLAEELSISVGSAASALRKWKEEHSL